jgi:hypothetical protein
MEPPGLAGGGLRKAIIQHFDSMKITQETRNDVPVCWSAGKWNANYWAAANMEDGITKLFGDLGLGAKLTAMKHAGLNAYPGQQCTTAFWLPVWKFCLDRSAKNGCLPLSLRTPNLKHFPTLALFVADVFPTDLLVTKSFLRCAA